MVLNNLFPVFALLLFGHLLKRVGLTHDAFLKTADKLIYYIFFPALLFWKIGAAASDQVGDPGLYKASRFFFTELLSFQYLYWDGRHSECIGRKRRPAVQYPDR
jgi:predicted permease